MAAAQLGLIPEELVLILQDQQEFLDTLASMGYKPEQQHYEHLLTDPTQPQSHNHDFIQEKIKEVLEDQERRKEEEYQEELDTQVFTSTSTYTTHLKPEQEVCKGYRLANEPPYHATPFKDDAQPHAHTSPLEHEHASEKSTSVP